MDGDTDAGEAAELEEAYQSGVAAGRAEAACDCNHREGCPNALQDDGPWWRRLIDRLAG